MGSPYNGDGTVPSATTGSHTKRNISSSTFATPIVVTTTGSHGFNTGDTVEIEGHQTNTAANGLWTIVVSSPTQFSLNGSVGIGVGGGTGYAIDYELQPAITIPSDGDLCQASTYNPAFQGLSNQAPFLFRMGGKYRLHDIYTAVASHDPATNWSAANTTGANQTVNFSGAAVGLLGFNAAPAYAPIAQHNDILVAQMTLSAAYNLAGATQGVQVNLGFSQGGSGYSGGLEGMGTFYPASLSSFINTPSLPLIIGGNYSPFAGPGTYFDFAVQMISASAAVGTNNIVLYGSWWLNVFHYRSQP